MKLFDKPINVTNWDNPTPMPKSREELFDEWLRKQPNYHIVSTDIILDTILAAFEYGVKVGENNNDDVT
jgi:hypothetical protein